MSISLVLPVSIDIPIDIVRDVCLIHHNQTVPLDIHVVYGGEPFSLARVRNAGAQMSRSEWIIFSDIDTIYDNNVFEKMIGLGYPAVIGNTRADIPTLGSPRENLIFYQCACAPVVVKRDLFESVGGYCEEYVGWGYEDSHFEHKLPALPGCNLNAYHVQTIHNAVSTKKSWQWGSDNNRTLFDKHMKMLRADRIAADVANYIK